MTGVEVAWRFLFPLRNHLGRVRLARNAPWAELLPLLIVFGLPRASVVDLRPQSSIFFVDLPAGFRLPVGTHILLHRGFSSIVLFPCDVSKSMAWRQSFRMTVVNTFAAQSMMND
jgi:hypothetical protein